MKDRDAQHVERLLAARGFAVRPVDVAEATTPDILAELTGKRTFVEVKARRLDAGLRKAMWAVRVGEPEVLATSIAKHNTISAEVRKANEQLEASAGPEDFRLLWYRADRGPFTHGAHSQVVSTLFGVRFARTRHGGHLPCMYAAHADFHRYRSIDGAVVEQDDIIRLFANEFSPRHLSFIESPVMAALAKGALVPDLREGERRGACCIVEGANVDRSDDEALIAYLRSKYPEREIESFFEPEVVTHMTTIDARSELRARKPGAEGTE